MNSMEVIEALQEECRTDRIKVEDFLNALADLCDEAIKSGESFRVRGLGAFTLNPRLSRKGKNIRAAITFQASKSMRKRLGFPDEEPVKTKAPGMCKTCGHRPGKVRIFDECDPCMHARNRATKKG